MAAKRVKKFWILLLTGIVALMGSIQYGKWSTEQLEFNHLRLPQEALPGAGPLTIALLGDIHNAPELLQECVAEVQKQKPDLIIFAGDLVKGYARYSRTRLMIHTLRELRSIAPTYAILGNHDYEKLDEVERTLHAAGIPLLRNEATTWQTPTGATLSLAGLGDWNEGDEAPERCLSPRGQAKTPVLLLSHDPESRHLLQGYDWHLMLSGHTHGGQLGNPFTGKPICLRSDMPAGHYTENGRHHIVTRGVGTLLGMRFFCPPEMIFIHIGQ